MSDFKKFTLIGGLMSLAIVIGISIYSVFAASYGFSMSQPVRFFNGNADLLVIAAYDAVKNETTALCDLDGSGPLEPVLACYSVKGLTYYKNGVAQTVEYIARGTEFRNATKATYGDPGPGYNNAAFIVGVTDSSGNFITVENGDLFDINITNFYGSEALEGNDYIVGCNRNSAQVCRGTICGNARIEGNETCDDGNKDSGDGCSSRCIIEYYCGDGTTNPGEECDDGNNLDGDGCTSECKSGNDVWGILKQLAGNSSANNADFGYSVDIEGNYAIVGDPYYDDGTYGDVGAAYIFHNNAGTWEKTHDLSASDGAWYDSYGYSVAISGNYAVVGAPFADNGMSTDTGKIYIYKYNAGTDAWDEVHTDYGNDPSDQLGTSVDTDGTWVITGIPNDNSSAGSIAIYNSADSWSYAYINSETSASYDYFGRSVAIDGNYAVVGAYYYDPGAGLYDFGAIYTYEYTGSWGNEQKILASDGTANDNFGWSVDIDEDYIIAGARTGANYAGAAYIFHNNEGTWEEQQKLTADEPQQYTYFGYSVAIDGDYALVGNTQMDNIGVAHFFYNNEGIWEHEAKFTDTTYISHDFAYDVALSGDNLLIGRRYVDIDSDGNQDGTAYIYNKKEVVCGDGIKWGAEQCDDGNIDNGDGCSSVCQIEPGCGNGILDAGEQCDDGNTTGGDGCDAVCAIEYTGCYVYDSVFYSGKQLQTDETCKTACINQTLTGGVVAPGGHGCLCAGGDNDTCNMLCDIIEAKTGPLEVCGYINCGNSVWGVAYEEDAETCDDGNLVNSDGCDTFCQIELPDPYCGDGNVDAGERCDDGNIVNGDGCSSTCEIEGAYYFNRLDFSPEQDCIEPGALCLYRDNTSGVINNTIGNDDPFDPDAVAGVTWACGVCDASSSGFDTIINLVPGCVGKLSELVNVDTCLRSDKYNTYYDVKWLAYSGASEGGAFEYVRKPYVDTLAPDAVTDLTVVVGGKYPTDVTLSWSDVSDNGLSELKGYQIKYSDADITESNWNEAKTLRFVDSPGMGIDFSMFPHGTWHFAVKAFDNIGNISDLSNVDSDFVPDVTPTITSFTPVSGANDGDVDVEILLDNVIEIPFGASAYFIGTDHSFAAAGTYNDELKKVTVTVPAGVNVGRYKLIVLLDSIRSPLSTGIYEVLPAVNPLPLVGDIVPSVGSTASDTNVTIYGRNFTGVSSAALANSKGTLFVLTNVLEINDTKITATVPSGLELTDYNVIVATPNGANSESKRKFFITGDILVDKTTVGDKYLDDVGVIDLSGFSGDEKTQLPVNIEFSTRYASLIKENISSGGIRIAIPSTTIITDESGNKYIGKIYPPRYVSKEEAINSALHNQLIEDRTVIIQMGNPDEKIKFDQDMVLTISDIEANFKPILWYYNKTEGKFELAGKNGIKDGITYVPGGIIKSQVDSVLGPDYQNYTMGILVDHMSDYAIGVTPAITLISPSSGSAGTSISITGTNFHTNATVTIGGQLATSSYVDTEHLTATVPSLSAGSHSVVVENPDALNATSSFTVPSTGGTTTTVSVATGGGGGLSGGVAVAPSPSLLGPADDSDTQTSSVPSTLREVAEGDMVFSRPLEIKADLITTVNGTQTAQLTGVDGTITIKPNKYSAIFLEIPENTSVEGTSEWDGKINPPLIKSSKFVIDRTGDRVEGTTELLTRGRVGAVIEVGSDKSTLTFSNPVDLTVPVAFINGTLVDIYRKSLEGDSWKYIDTTIIKNGKVTFQTNSLSYFAIATAEKERRLKFAAPEVELAPIERPAEKILATAKSVFRDIQNHWADAYITRLYNENIVAGKGEGLFAPNDPVTRAELVKIALKTFNYEIPAIRLTTNPFPDVDLKAWYAIYAELAKREGILTGFPDGMRPNEAITRAEALKILLTASKLPLVFDTDKNFTDTNPNAWYMWYVRYAYEKGIVSGYADGSFQPANTVTRAEVAKMTVKLMDLYLNQ